MTSKSPTQNSAQTIASVTASTSIRQTLQEIHTDIGKLTTECRPMGIQPTQESQESTNALVANINALLNRISALVSSELDGVAGMRTDGPPRFAPANISTIDEARAAVVSRRGILCSSLDLLQQEVRERLHEEPGAVGVESEANQQAEYEPDEKALLTLKQRAGRIVSSIFKWDMACDDFYTFAEAQE